MLRNVEKWDRMDVELVSADVPAVLSVLSARGADIYHIRQSGPLTVTATVGGRNEALLREAAERSGSMLRVRRRYGILQILNRIRSRPILLLAVSILLTASMWLPERVLFISVEGNSRVSTKQILEAAASCGMEFGTARSSIRSEKVKNGLLKKIPLLQWAGINTKGCTAVISVREREDSEESGEEFSVTSLVASRDGIIQSCTATAGSMQCSPGQAVRAGDVLVSGYTDCGISVRAEQAKGEIIALTVRPISVSAPLNYREKGQRGKIFKNFWLTIGKKQIFIGNNSGISDTSCDKIREDYVLTLPGGFQLPVTLSVETVVLHGSKNVTADGMLAEAISRNAAQSYLLSDMISGRILDGDISEEYSDNLYRIQGCYLCSEMIARVRNEEIIIDYGKNSGTDSER